MSDKESNNNPQDDKKSKDSAELESTSTDNSSQPEESVPTLAVPVDSNDDAQSKATDEQAEPEKSDAEFVKTEPAATTAKAEKTAKPKRSWLAVLAIILALVALAGGGYLYQQLLLLKQQNQQLQSTTSALDSSLSNANQQAQSLASESSSQANELSKLNSDLQQQQQNVNELQDRLTKSMKQISQIGTNKRKDWLLAEAEYLLRLANQRVLLEKSPVGALALLRSTDQILRETDDVSIYNVRKAVAHDIASLEAVPTLDVDGVFLKLAALNERVDHLSLLPVTDQKQLPKMLKEVTSDSMVESWKQGLKETWHKVLDKLGSLVIIQHRDKPIEPLLTHDQAYFIQQNLHLMIEQAQLSLLQGHQPSYDASLKKASDWISRYFRADDSSTQALLKGLDELKPVQVAPQLPDISGSLKALKQYFADVHRGEGEG